MPRFPKIRTLVFDAVFATALTAPALAQPYPSTYQEPKCDNNGKCILLPVPVQASSGAVAPEGVRVRAADPDSASAYAYGIPEQGTLGDFSGGRDLSIRSQH